MKHYVMYKTKFYKKFNPIQYTHPVDIIFVLLCFVAILQFTVYPVEPDTTLWFELYGYTGNLDPGVLYSFFTHSSVYHFVSNLYGLLVYRLFFTHLHNSELNDIIELLVVTLCIGIGTNLLVFGVSTLYTTQFIPVLGFSGVLFGYFGIQIVSFIREPIASVFSIQQYAILFSALCIVFTPVLTGNYDLTVMGHFTGFSLGVLYAIYSTHSN